MHNFGYAQLYAALLLAGAVMIALELFLPGGIVGTLGVIALVSAAGVALKAFPGVWGPVGACASILISIAAIWLLVKYFGKTRVGKALTMGADLNAAHSAEEGNASLLGQTGKAVSELHPGGFAEIGDRRVDVITRGEDIPAGTAVKVVDVEGNRIVVAAAENPAPATPPKA